MPRVKNRIQNATNSPTNPNKYQIKNHAKAWVATAARKILTIFQNHRIDTKGSFRDGPPTIIPNLVNLPIALNLPNRN